jgi:hypothetical protein
VGWADIFDRQNIKNPPLYRTFLASSFNSHIKALGQLYYTFLAETALGPISYRHFMQKVKTGEYLAYVTL